MGSGDGLDDREPEAMAVWTIRAATVESLERPEHPVDVFFRDDRPAVRDGENGVAGFGSCCDGDVTATGNLDQDTRENIVGLLDHLWRDRGLTLILVTHDAAIARRAQRVGVMTDGHLIRQESPVQ
jgi:hypothetical protein